jgi:hypothetical protein
MVEQNRMDQMQQSSEIAANLSQAKEGLNVV